MKGGQSAHELVVEVDAGHQRMMEIEARSLEAPSGEVSCWWPLEGRGERGIR